MRARLSRGGELEPIWVPDEVHGAIRDLVRARQAASYDVRKARQRIQSFLRKHDRRYSRKPWLVATAIARELVGFIWTIGQKFHPQRLQAA